MFLNYLKTAFRSLLRNRTFSIINILGLAIGLAASLTIALWVFDELSYDRFHANAEDIYRVERHINYQGQSFFVPVTGAIYGTAMLQDYPEVIDMCRIDYAQLSVEDKNKSRINEIIHFADSSFFNVFTFPLERGDPATALVEPYSMVISGEYAKKYFGDEDPMNSVIRVDWEGEMRSFKVTGVFAALPHNKHFHFQMVSSFSTMHDVYDSETLSSWVSNYLYTYVLLRHRTDKDMLEGKLDRLAAEKILPALKSFFAGDGGDPEGSIRIFLRPITSIHLKSGLMWDIEVQGDITTVYVFSVVSFLILLIACFNFMSLSTAVANTRSLEVGIRKTVGSSKGQLVRQFIGESMLTAFLAFILSVAIIQAILPWFNTLTDKSLTLTSFLMPGNLLILVVIVLVTGFISGTYPAFYLSAVRPILVLKGRMQESRGGFSFRQVLVVVQFGISIALIIGTFTAMRQMNFLHNKPLGYDKENVMVLPVEGNQVPAHFESFKSGLLSNPVILDVASSSKVPAEREYSDTGWETDLQDELFLSRFFAVSWDFFETYRLEMAAGRAFDRDHPTDRNFKVIINETAARKLGYQAPADAIGEKWTADWVRERVDSLSEGQIIGVVKDFHFQSLKNKLEPLTMVLDEDWMTKISIRYEPGRDQEAIAWVGKAWKEHFPDIHFEYSFVNDYLTRFYKADQKLQTILLVFTVLAIVIACLGLFGLAIFVARQRTKEIGVRKAMGSSVFGIVVLLSRAFSRWVVIGNLIAWPLAWYFMSEWLSSFAYRTHLSPWIFISAGLLALVIALLTISHRAYVTARRNPVDALRYE